MRVLLTEGCLEPGYAAAMAYPERRPRGLTLAEAFAWFTPIPVGDCLLWPGATMGPGYGCLRHGGRALYAHAVAYELAHGPIPQGMEVDHIDCTSRRCIKAAHLRAVTRKQNNENRTVLNRNNTSGIRGVSWHAATQRWTARVKHHRHTYAAYFDSIQDAEAWVIAKRLELFTNNQLDRRAS